jgi:hypothetical protein
LTRSHSNLEKENINLHQEKELIEKNQCTTVVGNFKKDIQNRQVCPNKERCNGYGNVNKQFNNHRSLNSCPLNQVIKYYYNYSSG